MAPILSVFVLKWLVYLCLAILFCLLGGVGVVDGLDLVVGELQVFLQLFNLAVHLVDE